MRIAQAIGASIVITAGTEVVASGRVVSARADGMSIAFAKIEQRDEAVVERWLAP